MTVLTRDAVRSMRKKFENSLPKKPVRNLINLELKLEEIGLPYEKEYKFLSERQFRFDYAIPLYRIGIEYEGGLYAGGRHTRVAGYARDCEKYNLATAHGWRVLRFTAYDFKMDRVNLQRYIELIIKNGGL